MDVSVIIVNYRTPQLTRECIDSIYEKTQGVEFEVIVVDNASGDNSCELLRQDQRIRIIESPRNGGFGYGNNLGIKQALGKYCFLLNSDTLLVNNAIREFFTYAEAHNPHTLYGSYLQGTDGSYRGSFHYFPAFTIREFVHNRLHKQSYTPTYQDTEVEAICGADMFIPRKALEEAGLFDENIFLYGEEGELQVRMARKGYRRMLIASPKIIHLEGESSKGNDRMRQIRMSSHFYVLRKYMNTPTYWLARVYYGILAMVAG